MAVHSREHQQCVLLYSTNVITAQSGRGVHSAGGRVPGLTFPTKDVGEGVFCVSRGSVCPVGFPLSGHLETRGLGPSLGQGHLEDYQDFRHSQEYLSGSDISVGHELA